MTEEQKLIRDFLAKGGDIIRVPSKNFRRSDYESEKARNKRMMEELKKRADESSE